MADVSGWAKAAAREVQTGPRGGRFYLTDGGTKVYGDPPEAKPRAAESPRTWTDKLPEGMASETTSRRSCPSTSA